MARLQGGMDGLGNAEQAPDRRDPGWQVDPGRYEVLVGRSSADLTGRVSVEIPCG